MTTAGPTFHRLSGALGAEVRGVDLRDGLDDDLGARIEAGLLEHQVLFLRDQDIGDTEHLTLARLFGEPNLYPLDRARGFTEPLTFIEDTADNPPAADEWHTDVTWLSEPPKVAVLHARVIPPYGGDTLWASTYAAYEALSPAMQAWCATLRVTHRMGRFLLIAARRRLGEEGAERFAAAYPPAEHPLVVTHPETGRQALFLGGDFMTGVVGLHPAESDALLGHLAGLLDDPNRQVRWRWRPGDVAIWDERCTNHRALSDHYPQHRLVRRCTAGLHLPTA